MKVLTTIVLAVASLNAVGAEEPAPSLDEVFRDPPLDARSVRQAPANGRFSPRFGVACVSFPVRITPVARGVEEPIPASFRAARMA